LRGGYAKTRPQRAYRVTRALHAPFDGAGAARFGARWNSPGRSVIYAAGSYAGALLEIMVHAQRLSLREPYHCIVISIPRGVSLQAIRADELPDDWLAADYVASREIGDRWLEAASSACLQVPAVTGRPFEQHVLINPAHPDARRLQVDGPYPVIGDSRLTTVLDREGTP
jgi:RES domain-containing protein